MNKRAVLKNTAFLLTVFFWACAHRSPQPAQAVLPNLERQTWRPEISRPLHAHLSYVNTTESGDAILVSTSGPNSIRFYDQSLKLKWSRTLKQSVRAQSLSHDGQFMSVTTYDGFLRFFDSRGHERWTKEDFGKTVFLKKKPLLVVFNDEDSEGNTAFSIYDYSGKQKTKAKIYNDEPIDFAVSDDESLILVSTAKKSLYAFSRDGHAVWEKTFNDRLTGFVAPESAFSPFYAVAGTKLFKLQNDWVRGFKEVFSVELGESIEGIRRLDGVLAVYVNSKKRQALRGFDAKDGALVFEHAYPFQAVVSSPLVASKKHVALWLDVGEGAGKLHLMGVSPKGDAIWDLPVSAPHGIFGFAVARTAKAVIYGVGESGKVELHLSKFEEPRRRK